jgi:amidase
LEGFEHSVDILPAPYDQQLADDFLLHWALLAMGVEFTVKRAKGGDVSRLEPWSRGLAADARRQWWKIPGAIWRLRKYREVYERVFERCDVLLCPTTARPAPEIGHLSPAQPFEQKLERLIALMPYTPLQNASGGPAISIPAGTATNGLPIGVQLAAPWGQERRLIELAFALESDALG